MRSIFCALCIAVAASGFLRGEEAYSAAVKIKTVLKTTRDGAGQPIVYPTQANAEITGLMVELAPGKNTGWHLHDHPCVAYILSGEIQVENEHGVTRSYPAGECFAELVNVRHCGFNRGTEPVRLLFLCIGTEGAPVAKKTPIALSRGEPVP
jgi:quercetin dioxygenase-like cupin family protein